MTGGAVSENDGLVIAMLIAMALSCGVVLMLIFTIVWNVRRRDDEVDELLEEIRATEEVEQPVVANQEPTERREPWERPADWWK
ncbi:hypothetical protein JIN85_11310 [Luteolibacter pohnpeiensis]|uniref:Uncharacterized protein n=1 Tax=Luteolibacter pohnpeiensis TaxID=454153 RepID=A0A934S699_9BACT|nr:hypothetical protein [Luteolibacter pohnpeiensis]MBK1883007.1 hypothetical protein [Luteolibacter pohnpeiensis]